MTEPGDEFEAFLKRRTVLPNGMSDDDKLEPPKALDAIVLKKAREAIHAQQQPSRAPRWATPVALAATILLCLSIVLNVSLNTNRPAANLQRMTAATADTAPLAPASPAGEGKRREKVSGDIPSHEVILPEARIAEARAARPPVLAEAPAPSPGESRRAGNRTAYRAPGEAPSAANSAAGRVASLAARADAGSTAAGAPAAPPSATTAPSSPSAAAASAPLPSPAATSGPSSAVPSETVPRDRVADAQERDQPALAKRNATAAPHPQDPKTWLQQIDALRAAGKTAQADAEMQRFRATFPTYPAKPDPPAPSEPPK